MGTNCLGPFLLTKLLEPLLRSTARAETQMSGSKRGVRLVWVSSAIDVGVPKGCIIFDESGNPKILPKQLENYMQTKSGMVFLSAEFAKSLRDDGVLSVVS
jgi:retinol dehydrogenase 12